ncbi:response regulator [Chlorobium sp. N1]|uniref:response regulator n=1 Tax=Chlorobium sp. N1 TaxID=2491138 RepID=UPI0013F14431|nr:response regulator [Chlorobium sp. N1]
MNSTGGGLDLLPSDVRMPEMDGFRLAEKARLIIPDLKVFFVSGDIGHHRPGEAMDGKHILTKPVSRTLLCAAVATVPGLAL